jgi:two-component system, NtrC family, sensor histidine kinase HydH
MDLRQSSALLAAFVALAVAVAILLRDRKRVYVRFALFALNLAAWHLASFFFRYLGDMPWQQLRFAAGVLVPTSTLGFFSALANVRGPLVNSLKRTVTIVGLLVAALALTPYFAQRWADALAATYAAASIFVTFQLVWQRAKLAPQREDQVRLRSVALAGTVAAILGAGEAIQNSVVFPSIGNVAIAVYMYFLYQTIITYRLIDLAELIAKAAVLGALTVLLGALYQLLVIWIGTGTGPFIFSTLIASFVILILYDQARSLIEERTIRLLFRERFVLRQTVEQLLPKMRASIDVPTIVGTALDALHDSRKLTHASVYLVRENDPGFALITSRGPKPPPLIDAESHGAFFGEVTRQKRPLLKEHYERKLVPDAEAQPPNEAERARASEVLKTFADLGASVVLPLISAEQVLGLMALGDARVSVGFPADEIALLYQIGDQIAVGVENSEESERLRERDRLAALGEMSAGLAHEIRNPLGAIKGAAQVLDPSQFPEETRELLDVIVEEVERLNGVVTQFLEYARPMKPALTPLDLNAVVSRTLKLFGEEKRALKIDLKMHLDNALPLVLGDADQLRQILLNLLLNAVDAFGTEAGKVDITTRVVHSARSVTEARNTELVELRVRDNGPGIDADNMKRIFVPFFTTKQAGTGLGLAICHRIMQAHSGRIDVTSRPGAGATFILRFPSAKVST